MSPRHAAEIPLHQRVDGVFLPLSIRQNRVEDIYLLFLDWLLKGASGGARSQTADEAADLLVALMAGNPGRFSMPNSEVKRNLIRDWARYELVIEPRQSNRSDDETVSVLPLHAAVAAHFRPPSNPPAYGRLLCELLSRRGSGFSLEVLESLSSYLSDASGDPVATLLESALTQGIPPSPPKFSSLPAQEERRLVWSDSHAALFQEQVISLLAYRASVGRAVYVGWLYALFSFFLATYFLRMAASAERFSEWLKSAVDLGSTDRWEIDWEDASKQPKLPYGRVDQNHARLLKRYPGFTAEVSLVRWLLTQVVKTPGELTTADELVDALLAAPLDEVRQACAAASEAFPERATAGTRGGSRLPTEIKAQILGVSSSLGYLGTLSTLNFESMSRASNNVMEWQFYANLARSATYGFAEPRVQRDVLEYRLSDSLLLALVHCHAEQDHHATLTTLVAYLARLGWSFDGEARLLLQRQLQVLGLLDDLSDASEAKYIRPLYRPGPASLRETS